MRRTIAYVAQCLVLLLKRFDPEPMQVSDNSEASAFNSSTSRRLTAIPAAATAKDIGRRRANDFLRNVFVCPAKSRRLEIAEHIKLLELKRFRIVNRIKKRKHQIRDLASKLQLDKTQKAQIDEKIRALKSEHVDE